MLGCDSGHGGPEYERITHQGRIILQLHHWDAHEHPNIGNKDIEPYGNGVVLWFQTDAFDAAVDRITEANADILEAPKVNPNARHREIWLKDPDGYVVVVAGRYGDLGSGAGE